MEKPEKRKRRSKEEIFLDNQAKEQRKADRIAKKAEKDRIKAEKKAARENPPTESEIVNKYVNRVMNNQRNHGRVNDKKFKDLAHKKKENKNLWLDTEFYFSVVFQSSKQRNLFLDAIGFTDDEVDEVLGRGHIRIVNGLEFSKKMGISLEKEIVSQYPTGNLELLPYVLDDSTDSD